MQAQSKQNGKNTQYTPRMKKLYLESIAGKLHEKFEYSSSMQIPRLVKISLNMGVGEAVADKKVLDRAVEDMTKIAGQKAIITNARNSISQFKIRESWPIGCKVTLRGVRMYEFMDRLINIAIPRIRDFRGFSPKGFDSYGNYNFGISEQIIFTEIDYDKIDALRGMNITIVTTAKTDGEGKALLESFNFPFRN